MRYKREEGAKTPRNKGTGMTITADNTAIHFSQAQLHGCGYAGACEEIGGRVASAVNAMFTMEIAIARGVNMSVSGLVDALPGAVANLPYASNSPNTSAKGL